MRRLVVAVGAVLFLSCASAQTVDVSVLINNTSQTGCTVTPTGGLAPIAGINGILTAQVDIGTQQVNDVLFSSCSGTTFSAPTSLGGGYAVGLDLGVAGGDVVEMAVQRSAVINSSGNLQYIFLAESATGADVTTPSGFIGISIPVPSLGSIGLVLLAALLMVAAFIALRRQRALLGLSLFVLSMSAWAMNFMADGLIGDWAGITPTVTDANGDATSGENSIDIVAAFQAEEDQGGGPILFFRVDVVDTENTAPSASDGAHNVLEDNSVTSNLAGNDLDGDAITFSITSAPTNGTLGTINQTGNTATVLYTPNADFNGSDQFTYRVNDGQADSAIATISLTVDPVNDAPSFTTTGNVTVLEDAGAQSIAAFATTNAGASNEGGQTLTFNITNNDNPALFSAGPAVASDGTLTFTPAAMTQGTANITLELMDDGGTANGGVDTSPSQTFAIIVTDVNDPPSFTAGPNQSVLEDAGAQTVMGWATAISPGPADESGQAVSFNITGNTNPGLFAAGPAVDAAGTLTYTPVADISGSATITLQAMDDGGTANGGVDTSPAQNIDITITAVNDAPAFTTPASTTVLEDAGAQTIAAFATGISAGPADESGQTLNFNISGNTNPGLFAAGPNLANNGTLTFTTTAQTSGTATITVDLMDNGGTANGGVDTTTRMFDIIVTGINDAPSFTAGADEMVLEDAGAQSVAGWATGISPGPADEAGQTVSFNITNNTNPSLFAAGPAVDAAGTLTYTPAADVSGSATITLAIMDNGGTANGGVDTSPTQNFNIVVTAVNDAPNFALGSNPSILEDAGAQTVNGFASMIVPGPTDESGQTVNLNITNNTNPGLFAAGPAIDGSGNLTYTPTGNASGNATITVEAMDSGGTANGGVDISPGMNFTITVNEVNDAPSFSPGGNQMVNEDSGAQTDAGWATAISPGPAAEAGQTLSFMLVEVSRDTSLTFSAAPAISAGTGNLTYTAAANAYGSAIYNVFLMDNGGTANGGIDTAGPASLTITINPLNDAPSGSAPTGMTAATNMEIAFAAGVGLLNGFSDEATEAADGTTLSVGNAGNPAPTTTTNGGDLSITTSTGAYTYNPPPGFTGMDSFNYVVCDDGIPGPGVCTGTLTVNIAVSGPTIWFVDNSAASAGDGRLTTPFNSLAAFNAQQGGGMTDDPAAGDFIFLHTGASAYNDGNAGIDLLDNQTLFGQATSTAFDTFVANIPPAGTAARPVLAGTAPSLTATNGDVIALANDNTIRGLNVGDSGTGTGITGTSVTSGGLTVSEVAVGGTGRAIDLDGYNLGTTFSSLSSTNSTGDAIVIDNSFNGSSFSTTSTTITNPGADGIDLANNGGASTFTFGNLSNITTTAGAGLRINNSGTVTIAGSPTISATGGPGIDITNTTVSGFTFTSLSSSNSTTTGINLTDVTGAVMMNGGAVAGAIGTGVNIDGGSSTVTYAGTVTNTAADSVNVQDRTGGAVTLSGNITDNAGGTGISMNNNSGGSITLSGAAKTVNTGANTAINLTNNTGATITFSGGGLDIDTSSAIGFNATGGGTINVTGSGNSVTSTTGSGINITATTIGGSGIVFQSVSVNGATDGVVLNNAGSGGFTITGTGTTDGSGGTIQNTIQRGVEIVSTNNVSLSNITFTNAATTASGVNCAGSRSVGVNTGCFAPIHLDTVTTATLTNVDITNSAQHGINGFAVSGFSLINSTVINPGDSADDHGVKLFDLTGTSAITNTSITGSQVDNLRVQNNTPTALTLNITGSTFNNSTGGHGVQFSGRANSNMTLDLRTSTIMGNFSSGVQPQGSDDVAAAGGAFSFTIVGNEIDNSGAAAVDMGFVGQSDVTFLVMDNGTIANPLSGHGSHVLNFNQGGNVAPPLTTATINGTVMTNRVGAGGTTAGSAVRFVENQSGVFRALADGNDLRGWTEFGLFAIARDAAAGAGSGNGNMDLTVMNGTKQDDPAAFPLAGIGTQSGAINSANEVHDICSNIQTNNVTVVGPFPIGSIHLRQRFFTTQETFQGGSASAVPATVLNDNNTLSPAPAITGTVTVNTMTACDLPM